MRTWVERPCNHRGAQNLIVQGEFFTLKEMEKIAPSISTIPSLNSVAYLMTVLTLGVELKGIGKLFNPHGRRRTNMS